MLALSARQLERKFPDRPATSLGLYQEAIHQLVPQLQTRTTTVVASCVVLCVLEMMSCKLTSLQAGLSVLAADLFPGSPKMWRRHLDGSASLILSLGINGFSGGLEQALFWCFARMGESLSYHFQPRNESGCSPICFYFQICAVHSSQTSGLLFRLRVGCQSQPRTRTPASLTVLRDLTCTPTTSCTSVLRLWTYSPTATKAARISVGAGVVSFRASTIGTSSVRQR